MLLVLMIILVFESSVYVSAVPT